MEQALTIIAIIIGWALNEFSHLYRSSREHKQAISQALSILLEVRFHTIYFEKMMPILKEQGIPDEAIPLIRDLSGDIGVNFSELSEKYDAAMEIVAQNAPLVAYEYRAKAGFPKFVKELRNIALKNGVPPEEMASIESALNTMVAPRMDELVVELATLHSRKMKRKVSAIVAKECEVPQELYDYFENFKANKSSKRDAVTGALILRR